MVNASRWRRINGTVGRSLNLHGTQSAPLGSLEQLEHLFWLSDQNHFVHFAVTALIPVGRVPAIGGEHSIASKNGTQRRRSLC